MGLGEAEELATYIGNISSEQDNIKENAFAEEAINSFLLAPFETVKVSALLVVTKRTYGTTSFIIDHPVYGELDSSILELDGGYSGSEAQEFPATFPWSFEIGTAEILESKYI